MRRLLPFFQLVFATTFIFSQNVSAVWKLAPEANAMWVGPFDPTITGDYTGGWWANDEAAVTDRACYFDDEYRLHPDGTFENVMDGETWLETWQGVDSEQCGPPVDPHDGSNAASWEYDEATGALTLTGVGAYLGLPKVVNAGELSGTPPADLADEDGNWIVPSTRTYSVTFANDAMHVVMEYGETGGNFWVFKFVDATPASGDLVVVAVLDLDTGGSSGKGAILQATADIADLSAYGIGVANNGFGTDLEEWSFPAVSMTSGQLYWLVRDVDTYTAYFGDVFSTSTYEVVSSVSQNGNDAFEVFHDGWAVDVFGETVHDQHEDGGEITWLHTDAWAFRLCDARTPSTTFDPSEWLIGMPNCADDADANGEADCILPTDNLDCAGSTILSNIFTLQMPDELGDESQAVGLAAEVSGHVTGVTSSGFYLQDGSGAFNGVYVYEGSVPTVLEGDEVSVSGTVSEYFSLTQIQSPTVNVLSSGNTLPDPLLLATGDVAGEGHEALLVSTFGISLTDGTEGGAWGEWLIDDGSGSVLVDEQMYETTPLIGGEYSVTGPVNYSYSNYKIALRDADDYVLLEEPCALFPDANEPNDVMADATDATAGGTFTAALCPTEDLDMYMVTAVAGGVISLTTEPISSSAIDTDTYLNLYDADGVLLASNDDFGVGYCSFIEHTAAAAGTFYFEVSVSSWAAGDVFDYSAVVTNEEPLPIVPQNVTATAVGAELVVTWDPAPTPVEVANAANLVDGSAPWKDKTATMHPDKVALAESPVTPVNSSSREAGETCDEAIAYGDINGDAATGNLTAGGVVWYSFTTDGSHESIDITTNGSTGLSDSRLAVYAACTDFNGTLTSGFDGGQGEIAFDEDGGDVWLSLITLENLAAGTYYVAVYGYNAFSAGDFLLTIQDTPDPCADLADAQEPNDVMSEATDASAGGLFTAAICPTTDLDMYMVNAVAGGTISLETGPITSSATGTDTYLTLYDAAGAVLATNDDGGEGWTSFIEYSPLVDGTFYFEVKVSSYSAGQVFDYSATVINDDPPSYIPTYTVYKDGVELVASTEATSLTDADVVVGTEYCYTVTQVLEDATVSDLSDPGCGMVLPGATCDLAVAAVEGDDGNEAHGGDQWFSYTATELGTITATTCHVDNDEDTRVEIWLSCTDLAPYLLNDDAYCSAGPTGTNQYASEITFDVVPGETYYFFWDSYWGPGAFTWYLYEEPYPDWPTNLTAEGGFGSALLEWEGSLPLDNPSSASFNFNQVEAESQRLEYANNKKHEMGVESVENPTPDYVISSFNIENSTRENLDVEFVCDFGNYQYEVGWSIVDAAGAEMASGGAPFESVEPLSLPVGDYTILATDTWGDGWNGNYFFAYTAVDGGDTLTHVRWTLADGGGDLNGGTWQEGEELLVVAGPMFMVSEELSDLTVSDFVYDPATDILTAAMTNNGLQNAWTVVFSMDSDNETAGTCDADPWGMMMVPQIAPGQTVSLSMPELTDYMIDAGAPYGENVIIGMADANCTELETDETNNLAQVTVTLVDPFEGITWNVYRSLHSDVDPTFELVEAGLETQDYFDDGGDNPLPGGHYVYHVTQTQLDGSESDSSNWAYAQVFGPTDFPPPTQLMGEADGMEVMLEWTAPDLTDWVGPAYTSRFRPVVDGIKPYETPPAAPITSSRQGGDTFDSAVPIDELPYEVVGTTVGYGADYPLHAADTTGLICFWQGDFWAGASGGATDVVYSLSLPEGANLEVSTCNSTYDTSLGIFTMQDDGTGTMVPVLVAANDDWCGDIGGQPYVAEVTCNLPAGDYYIVVGGYSTAQGDYEMSVRDLNEQSPVYGYGVHRDGVMVGMTDHVDSTSFHEFAFDPTMPDGGEHEYVVTAMYSDFGIESPSEPVTVTTMVPEFACEGPQNLTMTSQSNNVNLSWESPEGGPTWITHNQGIPYVWGATEGGEVEYSAVAVMEQGDLFPHRGLELTHVSFMPINLFTPPAGDPDNTSTYQAMVWNLETGDVITQSAMFDLQDYLPLQNPLVMVDAELESPVTIDWRVPLAFGVHVVGTGFPMLMDDGTGDLGLNYLVNEDGVLQVFPYNWAVWGYVDYPSSDGEGLRIGQYDLSSIGSVGQIESTEMTYRVDSQISSSLPNRNNRDLLSYHVYRNDVAIGMTESGVNMFMDDWVPFGDHHYYVTALYDNSVECGESEHSDTVMVGLVNTPPGNFDLMMPQNESEIILTMDNMDESVSFFWAQSFDQDNDVVHYHPHAVGFHELDTLVEMEAPVMVQPNPSFEDGLDTYIITEGTNSSLEATGNDIYGGTAGVDTLTAYDGDHALKVWGQNSGVYPNWSYVYQNHILSDLGLGTGDAVAIEGHIMSPAPDYVGQGNNGGYLFLSFWDEAGAALPYQQSAHMDKTMTPNDWHQFFALAEVPENAHSMNAGVAYMQESDQDHGAVYFDDVNVFVPVTFNGMEISHEELTAAAMADGVHHLTVHWNVGAMDVWDETPSSNGPFQFTIDLSATLGTDDSMLPDVFALHNNYPNPFNPVTNITYDIPEVANVSLEIYNVMGQKVRTLASGSHEPGRYRVLWNATNDFGEGLSSGMYIYKIQAGDFVSVKKLILMK